MSFSEALSCGRGDWESGRLGEEPNPSPPVSQSPGPYRLDV
jgi:hypothetical protein